MTVAIFPGSFDPITNGHIDIIETSSKIFEKIIVAVTYNSEKRSFLPLEIRKKLIEDSVLYLNNVEVKSYEGLTIDFAKTCSATVMVRGLRNTCDFEYESNLAGINSSLSPDIKTIFLLTRPENTFISSSAVRDILKNNGNISSMVPNAVYEYLKFS